MTLPRPNPDLKRLTAEEKAWLIAAGHADASVWQAAVYTQRPKDTVYSLWRRAMIDRRRSERRQQPERRRYTCTRCGYNGGQGK